MCGKSLIKPIVYQLNVEKLVKQWCSQDLEVGAQGAHGQSPWWGGCQGAKPPRESSQHITYILLPNHAQFCVFSRTGKA